MLTLIVLFILMIGSLFGVLVGVFSLKIDIENFKMVCYKSIVWHVFLTIVFGAAFIGLFIGTQSILSWGA